MRKVDENFLKNCAKDSLKIANIEKYGEIKFL